MTRSFIVSGNLFVYYEEGNRHKHLAPDVLVSRIPKGNRDYYLIWEEGKTLDLVIEVTSRSTKEEDLEDKFHLYQDILKVREYFLFDPLDEYLKPALQGYRLRKGKYVRIRNVNGRLASAVLGLHLERDGSGAAAIDPATSKRLSTAPRGCGTCRGRKSSAFAASWKALRRRLPRES